MALDMIWRDLSSSAPVFLLLGRGLSVDSYPGDSVIDVSGDDRIPVSKVPLKFG